MFDSTTDCRGDNDGQPNHKGPHQYGHGSVVFLKDFVLSISGGKPVKDTVADVQKAKANQGVDHREEQQAKIGEVHGGIVRQWLGYASRV